MRQSTLEPNFCTDLGEYKGCVAGSLPAAAEDQRGLIMNFFIIYNEMLMKLAD
jgi:hypothetical protein